MSSADNSDDERYEEEEKSQAYSPSYYMSPSSYYGVTARHSKHPLTRKPSADSQSDFHVAFLHDTYGISPIVSQSRRIQLAEHSANYREVTPRPLGRAVNLGVDLPASVQGRTVRRKQHPTRPLHGAVVHMTPQQRAMELVQQAAQNQPEYQHLFQQQFPSYPQPQFIHQNPSSFYMSSPQQSPAASPAQFPYLPSPPPASASARPASASSTSRSMRMATGTTPSHSPSPSASARPHSAAIHSSKSRPTSEDFSSTAPLMHFQPQQAWQPVRPATATPGGRYDDYGSQNAEFTSPKSVPPALDVSTPAAEHEDSEYQTSNQPLPNQKLYMIRPSSAAPTVTTAAQPSPKAGSGGFTPLRQTFVAQPKKKESFDANATTPQNQDHLRPPIASPTPPSHPSHPSITSISAHHHPSPSTAAVQSLVGPRLIITSPRDEELDLSDPFVRQAHSVLCSLLPSDKVPTSYPYIHYLPIETVLAAPKTNFHRPTKIAIAKLGPPVSRLVDLHLSLSQMQQIAARFDGLPCVVLGRKMEQKPNCGVKIEAIEVGPGTLFEHVTVAATKARLIDFLSTITDQFRHELWQMLTNLPRLALWFIAFDQASEIVCRLSEMGVRARVVHMEQTSEKDIFHPTSYKTSPTTHPSTHLTTTTSNSHVLQPKFAVETGLTLYSVHLSSVTRYSMPILRILTELFRTKQIPNFIAIPTESEKAEAKAAQERAEIFKAAHAHYAVVPMRDQTLAHAQNHHVNLARNGWVSPNEMRPTSASPISATSPFSPRGVKDSNSATGLTPQQLNKLPARAQKSALRKEILLILNQKVYMKSKKEKLVIEKHLMELSRQALEGEVKAIDSRAEKTAARLAAEQSALEERMRVAKDQKDREDAFIETEKAILEQRSTTATQREANIATTQEEIKNHFAVIETEKLNVLSELDSIENEIRMLSLEHRSLMEEHDDLTKAKGDHAAEQERLAGEIAKNQEEETRLQNEKKRLEGEANRLAEEERNITEVKRLVAEEKESIAKEQENIATSQKALEEEKQGIERSREESKALLQAEADKIRAQDLEMKASIESEQQALQNKLAELRSVENHLHLSKNLDLETEKLEVERREISEARRKLEAETIEARRKLEQEEQEHRSKLEADTQERNKKLEAETLERNKRLEADAQERNKDLDARSSNMEMEAQARIKEATEKLEEDKRQLQEELKRTEETLRAEHEATMKALQEREEKLREADRERELEHLEKVKALTEQKEQLEHEEKMRQEKAAAEKLEMYKLKRQQMSAANNPLQINTTSDGLASARGSVSGPAGTSNPVSPAPGSANSIPGVASVKSAYEAAQSVKKLVLTADDIAAMTPKEKKEYAKTQANHAEYDEMYRQYLGISFKHIKKHGPPTIFLNLDISVEKVDKVNVLLGGMPIVEVHNLRGKVSSFVQETEFGKDVTHHFMPLLLDVMKVCAMQLERPILLKVTQHTRDPSEPRTYIGETQMNLIELQSHKQVPILNLDKRRKEGKKYTDSGTMHIHQAELYVQSSHGLLNNPSPNLKDPNAPIYEKLTKCLVRFDVKGVNLTMGGGFFGPSKDVAPLMEFYRKDNSTGTWATTSFYKSEVQIGSNVTFVPVRFGYFDSCYADRSRPILCRLKHDTNIGKDEVITEFEFTIATMLAAGDKGKDFPAGAVDKKTGQPSGKLVFSHFHSYSALADLITLCEAANLQPTPPVKTKENADLPPLGLDNMCVENQRFIKMHEANPQPILFGRDEPEPVPVATGPASAPTTPLVKPVTFVRKGDSSGGSSGTSSATHSRRPSANLPEKGTLSTKKKK